MKMNENNTLVDPLFIENYVDTLHGRKTRPCIFKSSKMDVCALAEHHVNIDTRASKIPVLIFEDFGIIVNC
jgi:hypothetical protein